MVSFRASEVNRLQRAEPGCRVQNPHPDQSPATLCHHVAYTDEEGKGQGSGATELEENGR